MNTPPTEPHVAEFLGLPPIQTIIPEGDPISLIAYYPSFEDYYPCCELQTKRWCVRHINPDWHIFDVGANIGYYSVLFGRCAYSGKVAAFEPTATAEMLQRNLTLNEIRNVDIRRCALGERKGALHEAIYRIWGEAPEEQVYDFSTVDSEMDCLRWNRLDLIKIDVDSFDFDVLKGASRTLDKYNPWVLVELNHALAKRGHSVGEVLDWLASRGYDHTHVLDNENFLLRRADREALASSTKLSVSFEREPVYLRRFLSPIQAAAAKAGSILEQRCGRVDTEAGLLELTGEAWNYGALWPVELLTPGPAIVSLNLEVSGGDIGVLCVGAGYSCVVGQEVFVGAGTKARIDIQIDQISDIRAVVIRKGPHQPGPVTVKYGVPEIRQAAIAAAAVLPISLDPSSRTIPLSRIAEGVSETCDFTVPDDQLEVVASQELGVHLGIAAPNRPPRRIIDEPLSLFRMETHDAVILEQLYRSFRPKRHLEFGTWEGFGTALCARACDAEIWTINLPEGETNSEGKSVYACPNGACPTDSGENIGRLYREEGFSHRVHQLLMDSRDFDATSFSPGFFDTILIDGGHTRELVTSDTNNALQLLRSGGLMIWHDFCPDPEIVRDHETTQGVVTALLASWASWRPLFRDLVWVRPSWLLIGVRS